MGISLNRYFEAGDHIHVLDCTNKTTGNGAFIQEAKVLEVDKAKKNVLVLLRDETNKRYKFEDYGRLIFNLSPSEDGYAALRRLPKPGMIVFQIIGKKIYQKSVCHVSMKFDSDETCDMVLVLNKGKEVSTKEVGRSIFLNEADAREHLATGFRFDRYIRHVSKSCTCNNDIFKVLEYASDWEHPYICLFKNTVIDIDRNRYGYNYYLEVEDDMYPIAITEDTAKVLLEKPEEVYYLASCKWCDRYR